MKWNFGVNPEYEHKTVRGNHVFCELSHNHNGFGTTIGGFFEKYEFNSANFTAYLHTAETCQNAKQHAMQGFESKMLAQGH